VVEGVGEGGVRVYEAYEVKKRGGKIRCLLLRRKKNFFYMFMKSLLHRKRGNGPLFTTEAHFTATGMSSQRNQ
jgi:hypothetical protein